MDLQMNTELAENYKSRSQMVRIMSEDWIKRHIFCPCCGNPTLSRFPNNQPVADFYCPVCREEFELKSKGGHIGDTVTDGAYDMMIARIQSTHNPNFFFMNYHQKELRIQSLFLVPKYFFAADMIEKRRPLAPTARRAGWTGCNILLKKIPEIGKIYLVKDGYPLPAEEAVQKYQSTAFAAGYKAEMRGWMLDILTCIEQIGTADFSLKSMYQFEDNLRKKAS